MKAKQFDHYINVTLQQGLNFRSAVYLYFLSIYTDVDL